MYTYRYAAISTIFILLLSMYGCGTTNGFDSAKMKCDPDWFLEPPVDKNGYRYSASQAKLPDKQQALNRARLRAKSQMREKIHGEIQLKQDEVYEWHAKDPNSRKEALDSFNNSITAVTAGELKNWTIKEREICTDSDMYEAFVLLEYDEGKAAKVILDEIKSNEEIYKALRKSDLLEDLEMSVQEYYDRYGISPQ